MGQIDWSLVGPAVGVPVAVVLAQGGDIVSGLVLGASALATWGGFPYIITVGNDPDDSIMVPFIQTGLAVGVFYALSQVIPVDIDLKQAAIAAAIFPAIHYVSPNLTK